MTGKRFHGQWIGETQGSQMPAHIWEITQRGKQITITTHWEGKSELSRFSGKVADDEQSFQLGRFHAEMLDLQHFVIAGWCTNDTREDDGPAYDVVFSRPGLAELSAETLWKRWRDRDK